jgi:hypothetical protein
MKNLLLSLLVTSITHNVYAQHDDEVAPLKWGFKAGITHTDMKLIAPQATNHYKSMYGAHAGVLFELPLTTRFGMQAEAGFNQVKSSYAVSQNKQVIRINYLALPLLFKYYFKNTGFSLYAGPQLSMLLGAKGKGPVTDLNGRYKPRETSVKTGIEYNFRNKLFLSLNYQYGLSDIAKTLINTEIKYNQVMACIGFKLFDE